MKCIPRSLVLVLNLIFQLCYGLIGEKRAEVKAANPDYKIGDIAKVMSLPLLAYCSLRFRYNRLSGRCGRSWTRKPR